jgi:magnesium-transporting ATPase (P-type)
MENILADDSMLELQIDSSSRESLENGSWWAKLIGIISIVTIVVVLCALAFFLQPLMSQFEYSLGLSGATAIIWAIIAVVSIITGVFLSLLMSFAIKTNRGVKEMNQDMLEKGISSLKVYLIVLGVFAVLSLVLSLIGLFAKTA